MLSVLIVLFVYLWVVHSASILYNVVLFVFPCWLSLLASPVLRVVAHACKMSDPITWLEDSPWSERN